MLGEDLNQVFITITSFEEKEIFRSLSVQERKEFTGVTKDLVQILQNSILKNEREIPKKHENKISFLRYSLFNIELEWE